MAAAAWRVPHRHRPTDATARAVPGPPPGPCALKGHQNTWSRSHPSGPVGRSGVSRRYSCARPIIGNGSVSDTPGIRCSWGNSSRSCRSSSVGPAVSSRAHAAARTCATGEHRPAVDPPPTMRLAAHRPRLIRRPRRRTTNGAGGQIRCPRPWVQPCRRASVGGQFREERFDIERSRGVVLVMDVTLEGVAAGTEPGRPARGYSWGAMAAWMRVFHSRVGAFWREVDGGALISEPAESRSA